MRSHLSARRVISASALGLALVAAAAACSSTSTSSVRPSPSTHPPSSATALITANWEAFFSGRTSAPKKITLLQNGQTYAAVINAQSSSSLATSASAKVTKVTATSPTQATVTYNVLLGTTPALTNQSGLAVYQNGTWKVGDASFCGLLALENGGKAPSVCSSAG
jgi:phage-related baseplate assembly protein